MIDTAATLLGAGLDVVPRVLGLCDRDRNSPAYGCCDRTFWHYRLIDFPNARFQESGWLLTLAYVTPFEGNNFYRKKHLAEWIRQIWIYWLAIRNNDGSTNELYPNERSFCATAFSAAAFVESQRLLKDEGNGDGALTDAANSMKWLATHRNDEVPNQMAASYLALLGFALLTGDAEHRGWAERRCEELLGLADDDGLFPEYGGFDSGYQSITMSALRRALVVGGANERIENLLAQGENSLADRADPEIGFDPSCNSRRTQYLYPSAFARSGGRMQEFVEMELTRGGMLLPNAMDDRYCVGLATDFFCAGQCA